MNQAKFGGEYERTVKISDYNNPRNGEHGIFTHPKGESTWSYGLEIADKSIVGQHKGKLPGAPENSKFVLVGGEAGFVFAVKGEVAVNVSAWNDMANYYNSTHPVNVDDYNKTWNTPNMQSMAAARGYGSK